MKAFYLAALVFLTCACGRAPDWSTSGAASDRLLLAVSYQPTASQFTIVLSNQSKRPLTLQVDSNQFHGRIVVTPPLGKAVEYLDSAFLPFLLKSTWDVPVRTVLPWETITWILPTSQLCDIHNKALDSQTLDGATVYAKLDELAVVPSSVISSSSNYISDNAKQVSQSITISR